MSQLSASRNTISPLLIVKTSRFSAQKGRYQFDTSPTKGKDSPVVDPFADPYAGMRRTIYEGTANDQPYAAESPTIRAGPSQHAFSSGAVVSPVSSTLAHFRFPRAGASESSASVARYSPDEEEDVANVGHAAMRMGGSDPFGTPRFSHASSLDIDVDLVITPPSPVVSSHSHHHVRPFSFFRPLR